MKFPYLIAFLCVFLLAGCLPEATSPAPTLTATISLTPIEELGTSGNVVSTADGLTTITFGGQKSQHGFYQPLIDRFNIENPNLQVQFIELDNLFQRFTNFDDFMKGLVQSADIIPLGWLSPIFFRRYLQDRIIQNLSPFASADPTFNRTDFYPGMLEAVTFDGKLTALPSSRIAPIVQYNKVLWAQSGLPLPATTITWPELRAAAAQIARKAAGTKEIYGYVDSYNDNLLAIELASMGSDATFLPAEQVHLDRPEVVKALDQVAQLVKSNAVYLPHNPPPGTQSEHDLITQLIQDQRIGIWEYSDTPNDQLPFAVGTLPAPPDPFTNASIAGYAISGGSQHPEAAWRWLAFLSANEPSALTTAGIGNIPARKSIAERDGYWAKLDPETTAVIKAILERPMAPIPSGSATLFYSARDELFGTAIRAVVEGKQSPTQAAAAAQAALEQLLAAAANAPPTPTLVPIVVATPVPALTPEAAPIVFGVTTLDEGALQPLVLAFQQQHPTIAVRLQSLRGPNARSLAASAAATDCFEHFYTPSSAADASLLDLQPLADADTTFPRADYPPALLASLQRDGQQRGLPFAFDLPALHYSPAAFAAAHVPPPAGWTFADLQAAAQQLTYGGGAQKYYGLALLGDYGEALQQLLHTQGVALTQPDGTSSFTAPAVLAAARTTLDMLHTSSPHQRLVMGTGDIDAAALVADGRVGMWLDARGTFVSGTLTTTGTLAPLPGAPAPQPTSSLYIAARTSQPEACWAWLQFLSDQLPAPGVGFPARRSLAVSEAFLRQAPEGAAAVYTASAPQLQSSAPPAIGTAAVFWFVRALDQALQGKDLVHELEDAQRRAEQYAVCVHNGTPPSDCASHTELH